MSSTWPRRLPSTGGDRSRLRGSPSSGPSQDSRLAWSRSSNERFDTRTPSFRTVVSANSPSSSSATPSLSGPVEDPDLVEGVALELLGEFAETTVRKLGVRLSKLSFADRDQASLDAWADGDESADGDDGDGREDLGSRPGQADLTDFG